MDNEMDIDIALARKLGLELHTLVSNFIKTEIEPNEEARDRGNQIIISALVILNAYAINLVYESKYHHIALKAMNKMTAIKLEQLNPLNGKKC